MPNTARRFVTILCLALAAGCSDGGSTSNDASGTGGGGSSDGPAGGESTLYDRLGGESGITVVVDDLLARVVADPKINGYFLNGSVDAGRIRDCLVKQLGHATGGPQQYPDPVAGCRDMKTAHAGLGISQQDFDDLVTHAVEALMEAGVAASDIELVAGALAPTADDIVEDSENDATVYQRVGRKPAVTAVVEAFVARVAGDARINGFFDADRLPRLTTCLVRQVCGIDGPCKYGEEIGKEVGDVEPGVSADSPCADMATAHAGLRNQSGGGITIDDFEALVEDLVLELDAAGVAESDKEALLGALAPLCPDVVEGGVGCG